MQNTIFGTKNRYQMGYIGSDLLVGDRKVLGIDQGDTRVPHLAVEKPPTMSQGLFHGSSGSSQFSKL